MGITVATFWRVHLTLTPNDCALLNRAIRKLPPRQLHELHRAFKAHELATLEGYKVDKPFIDDAFDFYMARLAPLFESALGVKELHMAEDGDCLAWFYNMKDYLKAGGKLRQETIQLAESAKAQMGLPGPKEYHGDKNIPDPRNAQMGPPGPRQYHGGKFIPGPTNAQMGPPGPPGFRDYRSIPGPGLYF